jgi:hypothetical protein
MSLFPETLNIGLLTGLLTCLVMRLPENIQNVFSG